MAKQNNSEKEMQEETSQKRIKALENDVEVLKDRLRVLEDIEAIQKLQRAYGYYMDHMMPDEIAELFTDDGEQEWKGLGVFKGKETIREAWKVTRKWPAEQLHVGVQISPYITVAPDGNSAKGRWYCVGGSPMPGNGTVSSLIYFGLYENDYVKEKGIWKIKSLRIGIMYSMRSAEKEINQEDDERIVQISMSQYPFSKRLSRVPRQEWPSPWIRPFHFKHPVTGKETSEAAWNAEHPTEMPPGGENWNKEE